MWTSHSHELYRRDVGVGQLNTKFMLNNCDQFGHEIYVV